MNWYTLFYLFSILDKLNYLFMTGAVISTITFVVVSITILVNKDRVNTNDEDSETFRDGSKWLKTLRWPYIVSIVLGSIFWLCVVFIPSRKDMIIIIAGGAVGEFVMNDNNAKQLPADITRFLRGEILKATAELTDEAKATIGIESEADKLKKLSREELEKMFLEKTSKEKTTGN